MSTSNFARAVLLGALGFHALLATACRSTRTEGDCASDADCPSGYACQARLCRCQSDSACGTGMLCNAFGNCQPIPRCQRNADCAPGELCDTGAGQCLEAGQCTSTIHCDFNETCKDGACTAGCSDAGDCPLGNVCLDGTCQSGDCSACPTEPAPDPTYCDFGEVCTAGGSCVWSEVFDALCVQCSDDSPCASGLACLLDQESCSCVDGRCYPTDFPCATYKDCADIDCSVHYCAPACTSASDCPNGYNACEVTYTHCGVCDDSSDCGTGRTCIFDMPTDAVGFCSCTAADCELPEDVCDEGHATCLWSCANDAECASLGTTCSRNWNVCVLGCAQDSDCQCVNGVCVVGGGPCTTGKDCEKILAQRGTSSGVTYSLCASVVGVCQKDIGTTCEDLQATAACAAR